MDDQIEYLSSCGYDVLQIADQLGVPQDYVKEALREIGGDGESGMNEDELDRLRCAGLL